MKTRRPFVLTFVRAAAGVPRRFYYQVNYRHTAQPWNKNGTSDERAAHAVARDLRNDFRLRFADLGRCP